MKILDFVYFCTTGSMIKKAKDIEKSHLEVTLNS